MIKMSYFLEQHSTQQLKQAQLLDICCFYLFVYINEPIFLSQNKQWKRVLQRLHSYTLVTEILSLEYFLGGGRWNTKIIIK